MYLNKIRRPFCLATGNSDMDLKLAIQKYNYYRIELYIVVICPPILFQSYWELT